MFDNVKLPTQVGGSSATLPDQNSFASTEVILDFQRQEICIQIANLHHLQLGQRKKKKGK